MRISALILASLLVACGGSASDSAYDIRSDGNAQTNGAGNGATNGATNGGGFVPEVEEFLVKTVASTDRYVFVPNSSDEGSTVARINGVDLSVTPIAVGPRPTDVVAFESETVGAVAFVLVEGTSSVAVIRGDTPALTPDDLVRLLPVPSEVNALRATGDGRHVLAYIDPDRPFPADASVASLQAAALLRLGDTPEEDESFELSLTRLIRDVETVDDGRQIFVVGREGVNRIAVDEIAADTFIPPIPLSLSSNIFPPTDLEVEVAHDASFLVVRSSAYAGVAIFEIGDQLAEPRLVPLPGIPTDIDLYVDGTQRTVLATMRDTGSFALLDVDAALSAPVDMPYMPRVIPVSGASAGLAQITADLTSALLYSTLPLLPTLGVYSFAAETINTYPLRNAIRSVAISPDDKTAVVVHERREEGSTFFQQNEGLTIVDIASGYRRPITLQARPVETVLTTVESGDSYVFVLLESEETERQGLLRVDLQTYRTDFIALARPPRQVGLVAGKIFVAQEADDGRITFVDVESLLQRTVSGYELNAGID